MYEKIKNITLFPFGFAFGMVVGFLTCLYVLQDYLFFSSGYVEITIFLFPFFVILLLIGMLLRVVLRRRKVFRWVELFVLAVIFASFVTAVGTMVLDIFILFRHKLFYASFFVYVFSCIGSFFLLYKYASQSFVRDAQWRIAVLAIIFALFGTFHLFSPLPFTKEDKPNVVLLVLDGLSQNITYPYAPELKDQEAYRFLDERGATMTEAFTNAVYTYAYFSVLYCGHIRGRCNDRNLLRQYSEQGYRTITSTFHQNGLAESNSIHHYAGLKSKYISQHMLEYTGWALRRSFHVFRYLPMPNSFRVKKFEAKLMSLLNPESVITLEKDLKGLIEKNTQNPFFILYHTTRFGDGYAVQSRTSLWDKDNGRISETRQYDQSSDQDVSFIGLLKQRDIQGNTFFSQEELLPFLQWFDSSPYRDNTYLIVTSDHGSTYANGHLWYGYNIEEDTARVPMFILPPRGHASFEKSTLINTSTLHEALMALPTTGKLVFKDRTKTLGVAQKPLLSLYDAKQGTYRKFDLRDEQTYIAVCQDEQYILDFVNLNRTRIALRCPK